MTPELAILPRLLATIGAHLIAIREGRDPIGHLFAIERLARSARADWISSSAARRWGRPPDA
jgi:hypothetical protein